MKLDLSTLDNEYVATGMALFLGLYAVAASRVELPGYLKDLFNNNIFRIAFLSLLLTQNFNKTPHVAIVVALVFVVTLHALSEQEIKENFAYLEAYHNTMRKR
jgi:hypothetical protein